MLRAIGEIQPRWVLGENVPGLINWANGVVFQQIQADLEAQGYEVFPPVILPACGKEAPHQRDRVWIIAFAESRRQNGSVQSGKDGQAPKVSKTEARKQRIWDDTGGNGEKGIATLAGGQGFSTRLRPAQRSIEKENAACKRRKPSRIYTAPDWSKFPTESPLFDRNDGLSERVAGIKALGNAVVPPLVYEIFKAIQAFENL